MNPPTCTGCQGELTRHCGHECGWWRCPDERCDHDLFDLGRGVLVYSGGRVERL